MKRNGEDIIITVVAASGYIEYCEGLGILGDPERGVPVAFRCTGHDIHGHCERAHYRPAAIGANYIDDGGQCYVVVGDGVNAWIEPCVDHDKHGDILDMPISTDPIAVFVREEYANEEETR